MRNLPAKTVKKKMGTKKKKAGSCFFQVPPFSFSAPGRHEPLRNRHKKARHATVRTEPVKSRALLLCFPDPCRRENLKSTLLRLP